MGTLARAAAPRRLAGGAQGPAPGLSPPRNPEWETLYLQVVEHADPRLPGRGRDAGLERHRPFPKAGFYRSRAQPPFFRRGGKLCACNASSRQSLAQTSKATAASWATM